jgi:Tol biopolymer transport system component
MVEHSAVNRRVASSNLARGANLLTENKSLGDLKSPASPQLLNVNPYWSGAVRLNPDGKSIAYKVRKLGVENIWLQPIDGSPGRQITSFSSDGIREFNWSPDGKTLGILREKSESDVVLLQETKE